MKPMDGVKNKRIRVAILELLKTEYPGSLDMRMLQFSLDSLGYPMPIESLKAHLKYLNEKGLTKLDTRKGVNFYIEWASLTAKGWDLLDGNIDEIGIDEAL